ncbi:MAG: DUF3570 domain-containing protein [Deltaproteobacteria bacterium]|nr:DUF3570 domain-containing protein [Deltaproteobacteria bacterium]
MIDARRLWPAAALALAFCATAVAAAAEPGDGATDAEGAGSVDARANARVSVYQDDDATTVVTSAVRARAAFGDSVALRAGALVDVVSSASVDVVAAATRAFTEQRDEFQAGADLRGGDLALSADYARSDENDYGSHRLSIGGSMDLAKRSTTLSAGAGLVLSNVGRAGDDAFDETADSRTLTVAIAQVLDASTVVSFGYAGQIDGGLLSSPYRYVRLAGGTTVPESHPKSRFRHALVVRARRAAGQRVAVGLDERLYLDSWGVEASTTNAVLAVELWRDFDLEVRNRFHVQSGASFYRRAYQERLAWMTADRELGPLVDDFIGPAIVWQSGRLGPFDSIRLDLRADAFYYRFFDSDRIESRAGTMLAAGLEATL